MDQHSNPYYPQQSNPYYNQQLYPQSTYAENINARVNQSQHQSQSQMQAQQFELQPTHSTRTHQYSTFQHHPRQAYYSEPHSQMPPTMQQHPQMETSLPNLISRAPPLIPLDTQQYPYSVHLPQEQYALRHVHSQPVLQGNPSPAYPAYDFNPSSRMTQSSSSGPSATYSDPMPSYQNDHYMQTTDGLLPPIAGPSTDPYISSTVPRLPPILQVERQQVTTEATQNASANRRRNEANFHCPVPGCASTFTRRFNLKGHLRSHTSERPFACEWPGCDKAFARQHDCKRHYQLHSTKPGTYLCQGCGKSFSRTDALNRHLRSDGGSECRPIHYGASGSLRASPQGDSPSPGEMTDGGAVSETY